MGHHSLEPFLARNLLTVRALLDQALREARRSGELQRLTAVVLLDAVNERVLHLVAVTFGLSIGPRAQFEDLIAQVKERQGSAWQPRSLSDIRRLHRARNGVQHEGLGADRADLASWMASTTDFVTSLVKASFGVTLNDVRLSSAVVTPDARSRLALAEDALTAGHSEAAVRAATDAFDFARSAWVQLHERRRSNPVHRPFGLGEYKEFEYLEHLAQEARNASLLYPLAADPGEVAWFLDLSADP